MGWIGPAEPCQTLTQSKEGASPPPSLLTTAWMLLSVPCAFKAHASLLEGARSLLQVIPDGSQQSKLKDMTLELVFQKEAVPRVAS